jgi:hypothetical protein
MSRQICSKCGKRKNKKSFSKHIRFKNGLDSRCKNCVKKENKIRNKLHKKAPSKPEVCPVCKKKPEDFNPPYKWHLDHDPTRKFMRGWLCEKDNMSGGKLGDSLQSACNWISYLVAAEKKYLDEKLNSRP